MMFRLGLLPQQRTTVQRLTSLQPRQSRGEHWTINISYSDAWVKKLIYLMWFAFNLECIWLNVCILILHWSGLLVGKMLTKVVFNRGLHCKQISFQILNVCLLVCRGKASYNVWSGGGDQRRCCTGLNPVQQSAIQKKYKFKKINTKTNHPIYDQEKETSRGAVQGWTNSFPSPARGDDKYTNIQMYKYTNLKI